jgi:hypothetical protein
MGSPWARPAPQLTNRSFAWHVKPCFTAAACTSTAFPGAAAKVEAFRAIEGHACMTSVSRGGDEQQMHGCEGDMLRRRSLIKPERSRKDTVTGHRMHVSVGIPASAHPCA